MNYQKYSKYSLKEIARIQRCNGKARASSVSVPTVVTFSKPKEEDAFNGMTAPQYIALLSNSSPVLTSFEAAFVSAILFTIQDAHPEFSPKDVVAKFEAWRIGKKKFNTQNLSLKLECSKMDCHESYFKYDGATQERDSRQWKHHVETPYTCSNGTVDNQHFYSMWFQTPEQYKSASAAFSYILYVVTKKDEVLRTDEFAKDFGDAVSELKKPVKNRSKYGIEYTTPSFTFQEFLMAARWLDKHANFEEAGTIGSSTTVDGFPKSFNLWFREHIMPLVKEQTEVVI